MIYFHETMGDIKDFDIIEAFYDRIDHARVIIFESIHTTPLQVPLSQTMTCFRLFKN